ncbi:uncharacterized protein [Ptychodera flava]|uniref:uncharacterized protein n=1 Tax=Ptychodera flava TaxID=63121 RepID=UPI00396A2C19
MTETARRWADQLRLVDPHDVPSLAKNCKRLEELIEDADVHASLPRYRIQIQLLGDSRVGKTSLRKKLMGEKFDPNEGKTVGIDTEICECTDVDENWRRLGDHHDDYEDGMAWYVARKLVEDWGTTEKKYASMTSDWGFLPLLKVLIPVATLFVFFKYVHHENKFVLSMVTITGICAMATDKTNAYRMGSSFAVYVTFVDMLYHVGIQKFAIEDVFAFPLLKTVGVSYAVSSFGFVLGMALGAGFRRSMAFAFTLMLAPCRNTCDTPSADSCHFSQGSTDSFFIALGVLLAGAMYSVYNKFLENVSLSVPLRSVLKGVAAANVFIALAFSAIITFANSPAMYIFSLSTLMAFGALTGLFFGRHAGPELANCPVRVATVAFACGFAYLCGWKFPYQLDYKTTLAVLGCLNIVAVEVIRSKTYRECPVRLDKISNHSFNQRAKTKSSSFLPIKLSLWDFAGDELFYNTHQVFIATHAIFLLVFNLSDFSETRTREERLQRIIFWLHSICTHSEQAPSSVFLVGSHRDQVPVQGQKEIASFLKKSLYDSNSLYCKWLIINDDNTPLWMVENSADRDGDLCNLQATIRKLASAADKKDGQYPIRWLKFQKSINKRCGKGTERTGPWYKTLTAKVFGEGQDVPNVMKRNKLKSVVPFEELYTYLRKSRDVEDRDDFVRMLQFFHISGVIIYVSTDPVLRQFVVLRPELLIDAVKSIVNVPNERERDPSLAEHWNNLSAGGVIHQLLLQHILKKLDENTIILMKILQCYDIICPLKRITKIPYGFSVEEYIVPSMRPDYDGKTDQLGPVRPYRMFYFDFGFFRPDVILTRLMAKCLALSNHVQIFRNVGRFTRDGAFSVRLELVNHLPEQHFIKVVVALVKNSNPFTFLNRLHNYVEAIRCREFPNLKFKCGVLCEFPPPHDGCSDGDILHILPICKQDEDFPVIGSTVVGFCNGVQQDIQLIASRVTFDGTNEGDEDTTTGVMDIPSKDDADPSCFDIYVICSRRDDVWVQDSLVPLLENGPHDVAVKVNGYEKDTHTNINYLKRCPINIVVISRHSVHDERCSEEREFAYQHHPLANVIHIFKDRSRDVLEIKKCLASSHGFLDYWEHKSKGEDALFSNRLSHLVHDLISV